MKPTLIFLTTAIISYVATIPPGPLSVFVAHTSLQKNIKISVWVAMGGVFCESIYALLAIQGIVIFDQYPSAERLIQWGVIGLLLAVGLVTFFQKTSIIKHEKIGLNNLIVSFFKGISLSLFNPALLPFWLVVLIEYRKHDFLTILSQSDKAFFVLGAGTGTFLLVFTYAFIADKKREQIYKYLTDSRLNKVMGGIFIGLAVWQFINLLH